MEDPVFTGCIARLRDAQFGKDPENWSKFWAESLSRNEPWAVSLNQDRKTLTVFIKEICDRWNPEKSQTVSSEDIANQIGSENIRLMVKLCIVMDRASAMYNMVDEVTNMRGMHWYADEVGHREFLQRQKALPLDQISGHTMNKRYLWLMEKEDFKPLGLWQDADLQKWTQPKASPLRILVE